MTSKLRDIAKMACGGKMKRMPEGGPIQPRGARLKKVERKGFKQASDADLQAYIDAKKALTEQYRSETQSMRQLNALEQYVAKPLLDFIFNDSVPEHRKGGIYIKPENKGKFNATKKRTGKTTEQLTHSKNPLTRKRAIFAQNAAKWKKKDLGGFIDNIAPLISVIPGAEPIGMGLNLLNGLLAGKERNSSLYELNQMKLGGEFKQYSAPAHEAGGQLIDANGNPTVNMPVAEIEKNENSHDGYVFSDYLRNPSTGNTYAKDAGRIARQTKRADDISKSSRILQLMRLKQSNEALRQQVKINQDSIPKAQLGVPYKQDNSLVPDFTIPSSTTPGILPILSQLPTIGGAKASPRSYPYPYQITESVPTGGTLTQPTDSLTVPENTVTPRTGLSRLNQIALGLKGASLAYGAYDALRSSEKEKLQLPDYSKGDQYYRGLEVDLAPALAEINMGATKAVQDASNQAGGIGARNSRVASILSRAGKNAASVQLQQQQANAGIRAQIGSREDMKAQTVAGERIRQQTAQSQNDATARLAERKFFSDLSQVGTSLNNIQYMNDAMKNQNELGRQSIQYGLAVLSQKYPNFKPDAGFIERLRTGTLTEADKPLLDQLVKFVTSGG